MWLIWRPGSPDPSRPRVAIHHDDPTKDRDTSGRLCPPIKIARVHYGMTIAQLLTIDAYNLPADVRTSSQGEKTVFVTTGKVIETAQVRS